jgi:tocopherol cyclase
LFDDTHLSKKCLFLDISKQFIPDKPVMPSFVYLTLHPSMYHGHGKRPPYFEGWYYKIVSADGFHRFAIIPGIILGENSHAFIQVLDGASLTSVYHTFPLNDFYASDKKFGVHIAGNTFDMDGFSLGLDTIAGRASGRVRIIDPQPWPVTLVSPGIMGWYAWVPSMECYHGVLSFYHTLEGSLRINGKVVDFTGGKGYMEKDWGQSFPDAYVWFQTNHFTLPKVCLTASVAIIPWRKSAFPGFIVGFWMDGKLYRFATYTGASLEKLTIDDQQVCVVISDYKYRLEMTASGAETGLLKGPTKLDMGKRIDESMNSIVSIRFSTLTKNVIFEGTGRHAGLEVFEAGKLLKMIVK